MRDPEIALRRPLGRRLHLRPIACVALGERISAQGPLVWCDGDRAAVDTGGGRIVDGMVIEPRRRDDG